MQTPIKSPPGGHIRCGSGDSLPMVRSPPVGGMLGSPPALSLSSSSPPAKGSMMMTIPRRRTSRSQERLKFGSGGSSSSSTGHSNFPSLRYSPQQSYSTSSSPPPSQQQPKQSPQPQPQSNASSNLQGLLAATATICFEKNAYMRKTGVPLLSVVAQSPQCRVQEWRDALVADVSSVDPLLLSTLLSDDFVPTSSSPDVLHTFHIHQPHRKEAASSPHLLLVEALNHLNNQLSWASLREYDFDCFFTHPIVLEGIGLRGAITEHSTSNERKLSVRPFQDIIMGARLVQLVTAPSRGVVIVYCFDMNNYVARVGSKLQMAHQLFLLGHTDLASLENTNPETLAQQLLSAVETLRKQGVQVHRHIQTPGEVLTIPPASGCAYAIITIGSDVERHYSHVTFTEEGASQTLQFWKGVEISAPKTRSAPSRTPVKRVLEEDEKKETSDAPDDEAATAAAEQPPLKRARQRLDFGTDPKYPVTTAEGDGAPLTQPSHANATGARSVVVLPLSGLATLTDFPLWSLQYDFGMFFTLGTVARDMLEVFDHIGLTKPETPASELATLRLTTLGGTRRAAHTRESMLCQDLSCKESRNHSVLVKNRCLKCYAKQLPSSRIDTRCL